MLKEKKYLSGKFASNIENFSNIEIFRYVLQNTKYKPSGRRNTDEVKQFALTLIIYSPKVCDFLKVFYGNIHIYLIHNTSYLISSSIKQWIASVDVLSDLFSRVFEDLAIKIQEKPEMSDCAFSIGCMAIRK